MERPSFATLPPELRCMIYLFATPPRYVYLEGRGGPAEDLSEFIPILPDFSVLPLPRDPSSTPGKKLYFTSTNQIPPLLHTCRESRNFLKVEGYELTFGARRCKQRTWFNYKKDILIVPVFPSESSRPRDTSLRVTGRLLGAVKYCRLHHLQREDKDRIRKIAQGNIHVAITEGFMHQRNELFNEPTVHQTSDLAWWGELCNSQQDSGRLFPAPQVRI